MSISVAMCSASAKVPGPETRERRVEETCGNAGAGIGFAPAPAVHQPAATRTLPRGTASTRRLLGREGGGRPCRRRRRRAARPSSIWGAQPHLREHVFGRRRAPASRLRRGVRAHRLGGYFGYFGHAATSIMRVTSSSANTRLAIGSSVPYSTVYGSTVPLPPHLRHRISEGAPARDQPQPLPPPTDAENACTPRRWWALAVLCLRPADRLRRRNSSLNVTLPTLSRDLHATESQLQWVVASYSLVFAGAALHHRRASATGYGRQKALSNSGSCCSSWRPASHHCRRRWTELIVSRCVMGAAGGVDHAPRRSPSSSTRSPRTSDQRPSRSGRASRGQPAPSARSRAGYFARPFLVRFGVSS